MSAATFRYDYNSPFAYLAAARIDEVVGEDVLWQPIAFGFLLAAQQRVPWSFDANGERAAGCAECERRAARYGLPPITWPEGWPRDSWSVKPLRATIAADRAGLQKAYAKAVFARSWVHGEPLDDLDVLLAAARDAGLDEDVVRAGIEDPAIKQQLKDDTDAAFALGVPGVPTVSIGDRHFWGDDQLEAARD